MVDRGSSRPARQITLRLAIRSQILFAIEFSTFEISFRPPDEKRPFDSRSWSQESLIVQIDAETMPLRGVQCLSLVLAALAVTLR
jgi:hypothetical protein